MTRPVASWSRSSRSRVARGRRASGQIWIAATIGTATNAASPICQLKASITTTIVNGVTLAEMNGASRCAITLIAWRTPRLARTDTSPRRPAPYQPMGNRARWSPRRWYMPRSSVAPTWKPDRSLT